MIVTIKLSRQIDSLIVPHFCAKTSHLLIKYDYYYPVMIIREQRMHTHEQVARSYSLWCEYVDTYGFFSEAEFNAMSIEEKVAMQRAAFGAEETTEKA